MELLILVIIAALLLIWIKPYIIKYDHLVSFTGGVGAGKTFKSVETAIILWRKNRAKVRIENLFRKKGEKQPLPELYANIPVRVGFRKMAIRLRKEHLLLQHRVIPKSVILLDEVDVFANQFQYNNAYILNTQGGEENGNFDEFCRFIRHYLKGGYGVFNSQATANENLTIRRRQNMTIALFHFRTWGLPWLPLFYTVKARNISTSDDIKATEEGNSEESMRTVFGLMPLFRRYDTYCYSGRYESVPYAPEYTFKRLKTNECLIAPYAKQNEKCEKLTTNRDPEEK